MEREELRIGIQEIKEHCADLHSRKEERTKQKDLSIGSLEQDEGFMEEAAR